MLFIFAATLFVSAALLFLVQPMIGKMILPRLGGTPGVWNSCMVFFQAMLLAGYGYTHAVSHWNRRKQLALQLVILTLPFAVLPFSLGDWQPPVNYNPVLSVFWLLLGVVGLPFFVVATSAPLLQKWFAGTNHPAAKDPYFLYGASNLGSMLALLAYPALVEPMFSLGRQSGLWMAAYALFALLVICCGLFVWRAAPMAIPPSAAPVAEAALPTAPAPSGARRRPSHTIRARSASPATVEVSDVIPADITAWRRLRWIGLAAAPSSLMLGVTTYLTTDIAAIPLFWVVPLSLYLLTFILAFSRWPVAWTGWPHKTLLYLQPCFLMFLILAMVGWMPMSTGLLFSIHVVAFFSTALVCHGELAKDRPPPSHLTEFYLWMSVGGVLGGAFNALVAPLIFWTGVIEYPLAMVLACVLRPSLVGDRPLVRGDSSDNRTTTLGAMLTFLLPVSIGLFAFWCAWFSWGKYLYEVVPAIKASYLLRPFLLAIAIILVLGLASRPWRFGLALGCLLLGVTVYDRSQEEDRVYEGRSFFGFVKVKTAEDYWGNYHILVHGGIDHGRQNMKFPRRPVAYFHPSGGIGQVFAKFNWPDARLPASLVGLGNVPWGALAGLKSEPAYAVVGLGTGTLAAHAKPWQHVVFYEIDPQVKRLSLPDNDKPPPFTYIQDALDRDADVEVILGDGRLSLKKAPDNYFHILVLDAFSSDAIPVHLLTAEALDLYLSKVAEGGVIVFNTTNRYVDITGVLADLAESRDLDWLYFGDWDWGTPEKFPADWVVMRRKGSQPNGGLPLGERLKGWWTYPGLGGPLWTDSYSNLLPVLGW